MRLTALSVCGTLLVFLSLSWTRVESDEGNLLEHDGFGPCAVSLRPEGPCRQGQDESTCPYFFSVPPLTVHLPKQLRELEKIVKDLQKLKDNVDQLRKMCTDCTVRQTERECGRQRERAHEKLNVGTDRYEDERSRIDERNPEPLKDLSEECGTNTLKAENTMEGNSDTDSGKRKILEEKGQKKWEAERPRDKLVETYEKTDKFRSVNMPSVGGNERIVHSDKVTDRNRKKNAGHSKADQKGMLVSGEDREITSDTKNMEKNGENELYMWRDKTQETKKKTQTEEDRGSDGLKMSENHSEHANKEREQHRQERKKEMERGIKVEQKRPEQIESIRRTEEETVKEGEVGEDEGRGEEMVQSVPRDGDGELASHKATERTDFVSIIPTPHSLSTLSPRHDSMASNRAITFASSLRSPNLSSTTSLSITGVSQRMTTAVNGLQTQNSDGAAAGNSEHPGPDAKAGFRTTSGPTTTATASTLIGPSQQISNVTIRSTSRTSGRAGTSFQQQDGSTMATTTATTPHQNLFTSTFPGVTDHICCSAKKNMSANTKTGMKPAPGRGPVPGEKHKPANKSEVDPRLKNAKNGHKPDRATLYGKKPKHGQKQKPSYNKPITDVKSKPGKDPRHVQNSKPDQLPQPNNLPANRSTQIPKRNHKQATEQNQLATKRSKSHQKFMLPVQRPQTVNSTEPVKDHLSGREPESVEISKINQNSKAENKSVHLLKTEKPNQNQNPHIKTKSEGNPKPKPDHRSTVKQYFTPVQEPESEKSETVSLTPKPIQKPVTELMDIADEKSSPELKSVQDSSPGQKHSPDRALIKLPDQRPKPSLLIPQIITKPEPGPKPKLNQNHQDLATGQKTESNGKPHLDQTPQTDQGLKTPQSKTSGFTPKSGPEESPEARSNKTLRPLPRHIPPTKPTTEPGATSANSPKPNQENKTDLGHPQKTTSDYIQIFQTDMPPTSGPIRLVTNVTHSPEVTEFISRKIITNDAKTFTSRETGSLSQPHTLPGDFKMSPNSRTTSDLRPQQPTQPPSVQLTTGPNRIMPRFLPSVIPTTGPGSERPKQVSNTDSNLQVNLLHNVEETAHRKTQDPDKMTTPIPSPIAQTSSTTSPELRSTNPAISRPEYLAPEVSTDSARELRVKINQVAAFFNNSLNPNGKHADRRPIEHQEDKQGGSRPDKTDSKLPTLEPSKVPTVRRDCSDYVFEGEAKSGVYLVTPDLRSRSFPVFCDMRLLGGGWTLLQRRQDGSVSFNRTWAEYRSGFGELNGGEFWLGNNMIHLLTRDRDMVLRVELEDFDGGTEYAEYAQFRVASERMRYRLTVGGYSGTAGDALRFSKTYDHNNKLFTTPDRDHDRYPSGNCGAYYSSGWWFDACMAANLNGRYYVGRYKGVRDGIFWGTWRNITTEYYPTNDRQAFKSVRMMIRPKGFTP